MALSSSGHLRAHIGGPKMVKTQRVPAAKNQVNLYQANRRKWSDWSECSSNCLQTRHRLNCDDLLQQQHQAQLNAIPANLTSLNQLLIGKNTRSNLLKAEQTNKIINIPNSKYENDNDDTLEASPEVGLNKLGVDKELKLAPVKLSPELDQTQDDEDYADEGDDEDEKDSCANVDTSKTFEERQCTGGQCKLLDIEALMRRRQQQLTSDPLSDSIVSSNNNLKQTVTSSRSRNHVIGQQQQQQQQQSNLKDPLVAPRLLTRPQVTNGQQLRALDENLALVSLNKTSLNTGQQPQLIGHNNSEPNNNLGLNFGRSLTGNSVYFSALIGSLVALILVLLFVIRKAFISKSPSYQWMLAKHTSRSPSINNNTASPAANRSAGGQHPTKTAIDPTLDLTPCCQRHHHCLSGVTASKRVCANNSCNNNNNNKSSPMMCKDSDRYSFPNCSPQAARLLNYPESYWPPPHSPKSRQQTAIERMVSRQQQDYHHEYTLSSHHSNESSSHPTNLVASSSMIKNNTNTNKVTLRLSPSVEAQLASSSGQFVATSTGSEPPSADRDNFTARLVLSDKHQFSHQTDMKQQQQHQMSTKQQQQHQQQQYQKHSSASRSSTATSDSGSVSISGQSSTAPMLSTATASSSLDQAPEFLANELDADRDAIGDLSASSHHRIEKEAVMVQTSRDGASTSRQSSWHRPAMLGDHVELISSIEKGIASEQHFDEENATDRHLYEEIH